MGYNPQHDCPAHPCVVPGKLGATGYVGATLNDTVALTALPECIAYMNDPKNEVNSERRDELAVKWAFAIADEYCSQRFARAMLAQPKVVEKAAAG